MAARIPAPAAALADPALTGSTAAYRKVAPGALRPCAQARQLPMPQAGKAAELRAAAMTDRPILEMAEVAEPV